MKSDLLCSRHFYSYHAWCSNVTKESETGTLITDITFWAGQQFPSLVIRMFVLVILGKKKEVKQEII